MDRDREQPTVLLVDDDVELCQMMAEFLGHHDVRVSTVHDGRSGLGAALKTRWDLVILDVMLPVIDGFEGTSTDAAPNNGAGHHVDRPR